MDDCEEEVSGGGVRSRGESCSEVLFCVIQSVVWR